MKKAYTKELQGKLLGSVIDSPTALDHFSTDNSIFTIRPGAVVYPHNTADVRKTVQFAADHAAAGRPIGLVPRGYGTGRAGGALGEGMVLVFPAHMDKILKLDRDTVTVQPGISIGTLQQTLQTHGRCVPQFSNGIVGSTVGGIISSGAGGDKSVKYGTIRTIVKSLKVVLSDGSLIETRRISARELNRRKGRSSREGELYRQLDSLILDHADVIKEHTPRVTNDSAGYALSRVRGRDGSFDLGQIFIGAEGTLGLITEVTLKTVAQSPRTTLLVAYFNAFDSATDAARRLAPLHPSVVEFVDAAVIEQASAARPGELAGLFPEKLPKITLLVEFDDFSQLRQKISSARAQRLFVRHGATVRVATDPIEQVALWKLRRAATGLQGLEGASKLALPFIDDGIVPTTKLPLFLDRIHRLLNKHDLDAPVWGHAATAHLHVRPALDLSKTKDVEKIFALTHEYTNLVSSLGGSLSGSQGDGLIRAPYIKTIFGEEMFELLAETHHIFDPLSVFNPLHKTEATEDYARLNLRTEYSPGQQYDHIVYT